MNFKNIIIIAVLSQTILSSCERFVDQEYADSVFLDGAIYTFDQNLSIIEAIAVRDGMVIARGTNEEINKFIDDKTEVIGLGEKMMMPAFHDAHAHPVWSGVEVLKCPVLGSADVEAILNIVRECLDSDLTKKSGWIVGSGFDLSIFPSGNPHKSLLDSISTEIPIYIPGEDGHSGWANSKALELAGITAETPNPNFGIIEKDPITGEPTGTFREPSAMNLVVSLIPEDSNEFYDSALLFAQDMAHSFGITSIIAAVVGERHLSTFKRLADKGGLNLRLLTSLEYGNTNYAQDPGRFEYIFSNREQYRHPRINIDSIKIFIDGVLEGQTGALLEPYLDTGSLGQLYLEQDKLNSAVARFDAEDMQIHTHAIGDRAVRSILDAFEYALQVNGKTDNRHHISHLQLISEEDIPRFGQLGVVANFQSAWAYPEPYITEINLPEVGPERVNQMYPIASVHRSGGMVVGGSDWAVSTMNPLVAIETAIRREDPENLVKGVLNEYERMNLTEMLKAYTINSAYLMHQEHLTGSIEVGKAADLIILEKNLYTIPVDEISEVKVLHTMIEGKTVYTAN